MWAKRNSRDGYGYRPSVRVATFQSPWRVLTADSSSCSVKPATATPSAVQRYRAMPKIWRSAWAISSLSLWNNDGSGDRVARPVVVPEDQAEHDQRDRRKGSEQEDAAADRDVAGHLPAPALLEEVGRSLDRRDRAGALDRDHRDREEGDQAPGGATEHPDQRAGEATLALEDRDDGSDDGRDECPAGDRSEMARRDRDAGRERDLLAPEGAVGGGREADAEEGRGQRG